MINVSESWNANQKKLPVLLAKENTFPAGIKLLLEMHSLLHDKKVYKKTDDTYFDDLSKDLKDETCKIITAKETSILWDVWHITRIEDIVSNLLIAKKEKTVFEENIMAKLGTKIKDTGNAMSYAEIDLFNKNINIKELWAYRLKTGKSTMKIIESLEFNDIKRKVEKDQLEKIKLNGGVISDPKSVWLLDFWGKKNVLGLIMMPITRHQVVHLNDCFRIKQKYNKNEPFPKTANLRFGLVLEMVLEKPS